MLRCACFQLNGLANGAGGTSSVIVADSADVLPADVVFAVSTDGTGEGGDNIPTPTRGLTVRCVNR